MKLASIDRLLAKGTKEFNARRAAGEVPLDHTGATFSRLYFANANLSQLVLTGSEWEECNVGGLDLRGADLSNAWVHGGRFEKCDFREANLEGATFEDVDVVDCDFTGARGLDALELDDARLDRAKGLGGATEEEPAEPAFVPGHVATHEKYEADIEANPDDEKRWLVYGDWLQSQGDLRGELIARSRRRDFAAFVDEHLETILDRCADHVRAGGERTELKIEWKHGFVHGATLSAENRSRRVALGDLATRVLSLPVSRFLRRLSFGLMYGASRYGDAPNDYATVISALSAHPRTRFLEHFELGLQEDADDSEGFCGWGNLSALWALVPRLRVLRLRGEGTLGALNLPELRSFTLEGYSLDEELAAEVFAASWPKLEQLEVWNVGDELDLDALLAGLRGLPLKHLGLPLGSCEPVLTALLTSPLLPRLEVLDLSQGSLSDRGVQVLTENIGKFRHLKKLNLSGSIGPHEDEAVTGLGDFIVTHELPERELPPEDEDEDEDEWEGDE